LICLIFFSLRRNRLLEIIVTFPALINEDVMYISASNSTGTEHLFFCFFSF
jgi:hypothetical protein